MIFFSWRIIFLASSFVAGFSLMTIELTAVRIVAPYIGLSVYTWTSIIGSVLLGHSIGSYLGGHVIDKYPSKKTLGISFLAAAILISIIPFLSFHLSILAQWNMSLLAITLISSLSLFFLPSLFLGTLYPSILKLLSATIDDLGKKSGLLSSLWSLGSILGTFLTGFYFISYWGSFATIFFITFILFILGAFFLKNYGKKYIAIIIAASILLGILYINGKKTNEDRSSNLLFSKESQYYKIQVVKDWLPIWGNVKVLFLDFDSHNIEGKNDQKLNIYTEIYPVFSVFNKHIQNILFIGGGSYSMAKKMASENPRSRITVIEIDPLVTEVAKKYFNLDEFPIKTVNQDARFFLIKNREKYDLIFGDAYNSFISLPWHLTTYEFNELTKTHLAENGVYAVNFVSALEGENASFFQSMLETFKKTFPNYYLFAYGRKKTDSQNIILVGLNSDNKIAIAGLRKKIKNIENGFFLASKLVASPLHFENIPILTDDFAPVERLMMPIANSYFSSYASFYYNLTGR